jgi:N-hydroxyarylamine O-acetyltransferase
LRIDDYLERINYRGPVEVSAETLRALQVAHLRSVPFENLDIPLGRQIVLEKEPLYDKVIHRRRGGFCYELNGTFAWLLRSLGFDVQMLAARVAGENGRFGPEFDHMALLVNLEKRWLADVGFGDSFLEPLLLDEREPQVQGNSAYRILEGEDGGLVLYLREAGAWKPQYTFGLRAFDLPDYAEMCVYHQTSPESIFTRKRTCTIATTDGRKTLTGRRLIVTSQTGREERGIKSAEEYAQTLRNVFGVELTAEEALHLFTT